MKLTAGINCYNDPDRTKPANAALKKQIKQVYKTETVTVFAANAEVRIRFKVEPTFFARSRWS